MSPTPPVADRRGPARPARGPRARPGAASRRATVRVFGHPPGEARISLLSRTRGWRARRALAAAAVGLAVAPAAALVPPHAPWVVAVLAGAGWAARRRWREETTLLDVDGACPRCGEALARPPRPVPLRTPHTLPCAGCGHEVSLAVEEPPARSGRP